MTDYIDLSALPSSPLYKSRVPDICFNAATAAFEGMVFYDGGPYPDPTYEGNYWWRGGRAPDDLTTYGLGAAATWSPPKLARYMAAFLQRHPGAPAEALYRQMASEHAALDPDGWSQLPHAVRVSYLTFVALLERLTLIALPDAPQAVGKDISGLRELISSGPLPALVMVPENLMLRPLPPSLTPIKGGKQHGKR